MPYPAPAIFQLFSCSCEACRSRGYHVSGTVMVRPSFNATLSESAVKLTPATLSSAFSAKIPIPRLNESTLICFHQGFYSTKLDGAKSKVSGKCDRLQPEFCRQIVPINVDMPKLVWFVAIEIEPIRTGSQDSRHAPDSSGFYRIAIRFAQAYTRSRNSDPLGLKERHPTALGATLWLSQS